MENFRPGTGKYNSGLSFVALKAGKMYGRHTEGTNLIFYCEWVDTM
jgi:hypothetical protein